MLQQYFARKHVVSSSDVRALFFLNLSIVCDERKWFFCIVLLGSKGAAARRAREMVVCSSSAISNP
jgi:hypothetical protein